MTRRNRRLRADGPLLPPSSSPAQRLSLTLMATSFIAIGCIGLCLLTASMWRSFVAIDALKLTTIHLRGAHRASLESLMTAAKTGYGDPLMALDLSAAATAMTGHPWVRTATLRRQLPNQLHIDLQEHSPKALLMLSAAISQKSAKTWCCSPAARAAWFPPACASC